MEDIIMTKQELIKNFLEQRKEEFGFKELGTVADWPSKGKNSDFDKQVTHFEASTEGIVYTCYAVNKEDNIMIMLIDDEKSRFNTFSCKIADEFDLLSITYFSNYSYVKLDLNNVQYIVKPYRDFDEVYIEVDYLLANKLKLAQLVYYENMTLNLFSTKNLFKHGEICDGEFENLQYYTMEDTNTFNFRKRLNKINTLDSGDIGYKELGKENYGIIYGFDYQNSIVKKIYSEINFFSEEHFIDYCKSNGIKAVNMEFEYNEDSYYTRFESFEKAIWSCEIDIVFYYYYEDYLVFASQANSKPYVCKLKYISKVTEDEQEETYVIDTTFNKDTTKIANIRQQLIDTYLKSLSMNLLNKDKSIKANIDGYAVKYSYNSNYDLLVLHSLNTKEKSLTIPPFFDATLPFFREDIEYLDLNNVQYIVERASGFKDFHNLKVLRGEKLRLSQQVNLEDGLMSTINRKLDGYKISSYLKAHGNRISRYVCNIIGNDIFYHIDGNTCRRIYLPSLEFYMAELEEIYISAFKYHFIDKVKNGDIGYESINDYKELSLALDEIE